MMIKASELRIGNYYQDELGNVKVVTPNTIEDVWNAQRSWCKPIPLTEEWLERLGFIKQDFRMSGCHVYQKGVHRVLKSFTNPDSFYSMCIDGVSPPTWSISDFEYVHQLMNVYYSLTGEELTQTIK